MKIRRVGLVRFRLSLREPLVTAAGQIEDRDGVLVRLYGSDGSIGAGEATPIPGFGTESAGESWETLLALAPQLAGEDVRDLDAILDGIEAAAPRAPCARAALDMALHDAVARSRGRSVGRWLAERGGRRGRRTVRVSALLGARDPARLAAEAVRAVAAGYGTLKVKVAGGRLDDDVARVAALREAAGRRVRLRLDANGGWKEEQAREALARLAPFGIELVEQPVDANDLSALARLRAGSPVRVAADESAAGPARAERVVALRAADAICVKLGAMGGIRAALRIAQSAAAEGIAVFVTSGLDGAVARAAALQLAAALPGRLPACGLATGALLRDDLAAPEEPLRGALAAARGAGLGVRPEPAAVSRLGVGPAVEYEAGGR